MNRLDSAAIQFFSEANYSLMVWSDSHYWSVASAILLVGSVLGMTPLSVDKEHRFHQVILVYIRRTLLILGFLLFSLPFVMAYMYDTTNIHARLGDSISQFADWFSSLAINNAAYAISAMVVGFSVRFTTMRYVLPWISASLRRLRNKQTKDELSDIRSESQRYKAKNFEPGKFYKSDSIFVGLDGDNNPIRIPNATWYETNMQIVGPTRYGKGVILGGLLDQSIRRSEPVFYIDPKKDNFAPHIMFQAAMAAGKKFYYLSLTDDDFGSWSPFSGGTEKDGFSRLESAFGLEMTGDPGTDFYKSQELAAAMRAFSRTRSIPGLIDQMKRSDANRINAELKRWGHSQSLSVNAGSGFSIEKAIAERAVVYVRGSLDDSITKVATKVFIQELIQESRRLFINKKRGSTPSDHITIAIDEVSFLVSTTLAQALATNVGFNTHFILAYQSQNDLLSIDDKTVNPRYIYNSINVNCQLKAVYGGADFETAEWASQLSGEVQKEVAKMERTNISITGGETWENQRMIGLQSAQLIHTNQVLSMPPRVFVFKQPGDLLRIAFSSFVKVQSETDLANFLLSKSSPEIPTTSTSPSSVLPPLEDPVSHAKSKGEPQSSAAQKKPVSHAKSKGEPQPSTNNKNPVGRFAVSQAKTNNTSEKNKARRQRQQAKKKQAESNGPAIVASVSPSEGFDS